MIVCGNLTLLTSDYYEGRKKEGISERGLLFEIFFIFMCKLRLFLFYPEKIIIVQAEKEIVQAENVWVHERRVYLQQSGEALFPFT